MLIAGVALIAVAIPIALVNIWREGRGKPPLRSHLFPPQPLPPPARPPRDPNKERLRALRDAADAFEADLSDRHRDEHEPDC
jgi:hypothetical protein